MTELDQCVRQAFDEVRLPDEVKRQTLAYIEAARSEIATESVATPTAATPAREPAAVSASSPSPRQRTPRFKLVRRATVALAACLAIAAIGFGGFRLYEQPTAFVSIDVNPSIELDVNRFGIVVDAKGVNEDGVSLLHAVSLTGCDYAQALALLTDSDAFAPYVQEDSYVEISVTSNDTRQAGQLQTESDARLAQLPCHGSCSMVDETTREAAAQAGMGVGRYNAALELIALEPDTTLEECSTLSMRQLRDRIAAHEQGTEGETGQSIGQGQGHGAGQGNGAGAGMGQGAGQGNGQGSGMGQGNGQGSGAHHGRGTNATGTE